MNKYTSMVGNVTRLMKKLNSTLDEFIIRTARAYENKQISAQNAAGSVQVARLEHAYNQGEVLNLFMPSEEFCNWLIECGHNVSEENIKVLVEALNTDKICIHFPTSLKKPSACYWLPKESENPLTQERCENYEGGLIAYSAVNNHNDYGYNFIRVDKPEIQDDAKALWYVQLIMGLGLYLHCFPDQLKDGIPTSLAHPQYYQKGDKKTVGVTERIVSRNGPRPHYRTGHFRVLSAERFTKKRFQTIFIEGFFVKGKAKSIPDPI
jgi:hypothetical protein